MFCDRMCRGAVFVGLILFGVRPLYGAAPSFMGLGDLPNGPAYSVPSTISGDGSTVVGTSGSAASFGYEPFRWNVSTGMIGLGGIPGEGNFNGTANGVSFDGAIVAGWCRTTTTNEQAFRWTISGGMESLGQLPGGLPGSNAIAVSVDGQVIVGQARAADGAQEPMRWTASRGMESLGRLSPSLGGLAWSTSGDGSIVIGQSGNVPFRWTSSNGMQSLGDLPGGSTNGSAFDITPDGAIIVGDGTSAFGSKKAARWEFAQGWTPLPDLFGSSGFESLAQSISADGAMIVGESYMGGSPGLGGIATLWDVNGARSVQDMLQDDFGLDLAGWTLKAATGISDDGQVITGWGTNPSGQVEAWIAVVPEPASLTLSLIGVLAIARRFKRRFRV